jgi:hypothetical protein
VRAGGAGVGRSSRARRQLARGQRLAGRDAQLRRDPGRGRAELVEAADVDAAEDAQLGEARGDELPGELADARSRRERLRRCKQELERAQADEQGAYQANLA